MEYGGIYPKKKRENAGTCWKKCETYGKIIEQSWNITLYQQEGSTCSILNRFNIFLPANQIGKHQTIVAKLAKHDGSLQPGTLGKYSNYSNRNYYLLPSITIVNICKFKYRYNGKGNYFGNKSNYSC